MSMAMQRVHRVFLAVHDASAPTDDEWQSWITLCGERRKEPIRVLVESFGGGPSAKQRKELADALSGLDLRSAILTNSLITRGIVTAISWLNISLRAFAIDQHQAAAEYLGLSKDQLVDVVAALPALRSACGLATRMRTGTG